MSTDRKEHVVELATAIPEVPVVDNTLGVAGVTTQSAGLMGLLCCCCCCESVAFGKKDSCLRRCCCCKFIFETYYWRIRAFILCLIIVPFDIYKDGLVGLRYSIYRADYEDTFDFIEGDIVANGSDSNWHRDSELGSGMISGYIGLDTEEQEGLCNIKLLFDQVNEGYGSSTSHSNLDEMRSVEFGIWIFFGLSIVVFIVYMLILCSSGVFNYLCCKPVESSAPGQTIRDPCCRKVRERTPKEQAKWLKKNSTWDKSQVPWYLGFLGMFIQLFEDMPQMCLLIFNVNSLYRDDGHKCMLQLQEWGLSGTAWENGGREIMIPEFISNDSTFIDFMYDQKEIFRSLSWSIFVICFTLCLTLLKAKRTVPRSENTTLGGKGQKGCCTSRRCCTSGRGCCSCNGCCSNVPFLEWALIITLWLVIVTPIWGCFYYGGVVVLNLEDTLGGAVILMGFVVSCMLVILFLLGWISFFFCTYTHHFYDDEVNTPETLKGGLRKLRSLKGRLTRQQTMELEKQYTVTTGYDGKPGLVFPNPDLELGAELRKNHRNNLTMYDDHDYNDHSTQSHQSYSGSVQTQQQRQNYQPHQNQSQPQQQQSQNQQQQPSRHQQPHHSQYQQQQRPHIQMVPVTSTAVSGSGVYQRQGMPVTLEIVE